MTTRSQNPQLLKPLNRIAGENGTNSIAAVVNKKICCGCGACIVACPGSCLSFVYGERYNFPKVDNSRCLRCGKCRKVCPSAFLLEGTYAGFADDARKSFGCFLIHVNDENIRKDAASGGFVTGLILHLMERGLVDGGIVARCQGKNPLVAESFIATDRRSLLTARGSKYAPVSSCTVLREVLKRSGRYVFVGTPCMIEALSKLQNLFPELKKRITLSIGFVCAGMASRLSTKNYIEKDGGVNLNDVRRICYRGDGWPGRFRVFGENDELLMDRPLIGGSLVHVVGRDYYLRCCNCLDHWARFADITVSDPWSEDMIKSETKGQSAILLRTERGKEAVASAIESGALIAESISIDEMVQYNRHLAIDADHERHSWMALYQLLFFRRLRFLNPFMKLLLRRKLVGLRTTVRALMDKNYYY